MLWRLSIRSAGEHSRLFLGACAGTGSPFVESGLARVIVKAQLHLQRQGDHKNTNL